MATTAAPHAARTPKTPETPSADAPLVCDGDGEPVLVVEPDEVLVAVLDPEEPEEELVEDGDTLEVGAGAAVKRGSDASEGRDTKGELTAWGHDLEALARRQNL